GFTVSATDPSSADSAAAFTYAVDWGDGSTGGASGPAAGVNLSHTFAASGTYTVRVTAQDKDGGVSPVATRTVTVSAALIEGDALFVGGTTGNDQITLKPTDGNGNIGVTINGASVGTFNPSARIVVYGQSGDDVIELLNTKVGKDTYAIAERAF